MTPHGPQADKKPNLLVQWFDIMFVMVLCFLTLLATMLLRGKVLAGEGDSQGLDYTFSAATFALVAGGLAVYMWYTLTHSQRELKDMVNHVYGPPEAPGGAGAASQPQSPQIQSRKKSREESP
jgi:hypothetical protein